MSLKAILTSLKAFFAPSPPTSFTSTQPSNVDLLYAQPSSSSSPPISTIDQLASPPPSSADVVVTQNFPQTYTPGSPFTFIIEVSNNGLYPVTNVAVTDTLSPLTNIQGGITTFSIGGQQYKSNNGTVGFNIENLGPGQTFDEGIIFVPIAANTTYSIVSRATATPSVDRPYTTSYTSVDVHKDSFLPSSVESTGNGSNNSEPPPVSSGLPPASADLAVTQTGPTSITLGSPVTYTIGISNNGPDPATNVAVTDLLPPNLKGVAVSDGGFYDSITGLVTFPSISTLDSSQNNSNQKIGNISFTPTTANTTITSTAIASSSVSDPNTANNSSAVSTSIQAIQEFLNFENISQGTFQNNQGVTFNNAYALNSSLNGNFAQVAGDQTILTLPPPSQDQLPTNTESILMSLTDNLTGQLINSGNLSFEYTTPLQPLSVSFLNANGNPINFSDPTTGQTISSLTLPLTEPIGSQVFNFPSNHQANASIPIPSGATTVDFSGIPLQFGIDDISFQISSI